MDPTPRRRRGAKGTKTIDDKVAVMIGTRDGLDMGAAAEAKEARPTPIAGKSNEAGLAEGRCRDGRLVVVSRDVTRAPPHGNRFDFAGRPRYLDRVRPGLETIYRALNDGKVEGAFAFEEQACASPLPRAYQWADGSAYLVHVELVRKAAARKCQKSFWIDPLMYQGGSDGFLGPHDPIVAADEVWGIDFEGEVAVVTGDVPAGCSIGDAEHSIRLVMLVNDVSLRNLIPNELAKGFGFFQSKPASAFSPVAVTTDELDGYWQDGKLHRPLLI